MMNVRLAGPNLPPSLLSGFSAATDHARVAPRDVRFDEKAGEVTVPVHLATMVPRRLFPGYRYSVQRAKKGSLVIRNVTECSISVDPDLGDQEVELLFGVTLRPSGRVYFCSAEEKHGHGQPCLEVEATVSVPDLELSSD
jgi:hypothetical protein